MTVSQDLIFQSVTSPASSPSRRHLRFSSAATSSPSTASYISGWSAPTLERWSALFYRNATITIAQTLRDCRALEVVEILVENPKVDGILAQEPQTPRQSRPPTKCWRGRLLALSLPLPLSPLIFSSHIYLEGDFQAAWTVWWQN